MVVGIVVVGSTRKNDLRCGQAGKPGKAEAQGWFFGFMGFVFALWICAFPARCSGASNHRHQFFPSIDHPLAKGRQVLVSLRMLEEHERQTSQQQAIERERAVYLASLSELPAIMIMAAAARQRETG